MAATISTRLVGRGTSRVPIYCNKQKQHHVTNIATSLLNVHHKEVNGAQKRVTITWSINSSPIMKAECSLPFSQQPFGCHHKPIHNTCYNCNMPLVSPNTLISSSLMTTIWYAFVISPMHAICPDHISFLDPAHYSQ